MAGALEDVGPGDEPGTLAMLQELVESQADGWAHAIDEIGRFFDQVEGETAPARPASDTFADLMAAPVPKIITTVMGRPRHGRHAGPADRRDAPGARGGLDEAGLRAGAVLEGGRRRARGGRDRAGPQGAADARRTGPTASAGRGRRGGPAAVSARGCSSGFDRARRWQLTVSRFRVHGDYHLGQVLWSEGDFYILDFEGEPLRSIAERRQKTSPLKDVAGMLRSFGYAAHAALLAERRRPASPSADRGHASGRRWTQRRDAFLQSYLETCAAGAATHLPATPDEIREAVAAWELDKAVYELNYELNNRPDWVRISASGDLPSAYVRQRSPRRQWSSSTSGGLTRRNGGTEKWSNYGKKAKWLSPLLRPPFLRVKQCLRQLCHLRRL